MQLLWHKSALVTICVYYRYKLNHHFLLFDKFWSSIKLCKMSAILQFYFFVRALSKEERKIKKKKPLKWMACANDTFSTFSNFLGAFAMFVVASNIFTFVVFHAFSFQNIHCTVWLVHNGAALLRTCIVLVGSQIFY